jgi:D-3-phosphoglycerate dehydrogenase
VLTKLLITPKSYYDIREHMLPLLHGMTIDFNDTGHTLTEVEMEARIGDVDGLLVGVDPVSRRVVEKAHRLRAVSKYGVGVDNIDQAALEARGIAMMTTPGTNSVSVAELTLGLLLACTRHICFGASSVNEGGWQRRRGVELTGKTLGLIGCGSIGREVAIRAKGLSMSVLVYDPYFSDTEFTNHHAIERADLDALLARSDFVSLHAPLNAETRGIIDTHRIGQMKPNAYIINTSRGELIDEDALYHALEKSAIAGAACDVLSSEPPGNHPLLTLDNFLLTPHIGAITNEAVQRMARAATQNLIAMLQVS